MTRHIEFAVVKNVLYAELQDKKAELQTKYLADGVGTWTGDIDQAVLFTLYCEAHDLMERLSADAVACVAVETRRDIIKFHWRLEAIVMNTEDIEYLSQQDMLKQAEADRDAIDRNIQSLKERIEATTPKPKHGEVVKTTYDGDLRLIVYIDSVGWCSLSRCGNISLLPVDGFSVKETYTGDNPCAAYKVISNVFDEAR